MKTTTKNTIIAGLFSLIGGLISGSVITSAFYVRNTQKQDYNSDVSNQTNIEINNGDYLSLKEQYNALSKDYTALAEQYNDLIKKNEQLISANNL